MDALSTLHVALLAAFLLVTALLLISSSGGLKRAADVALFWRDARVQPLPIAPLVFAGLMIVLLVSTQVVELGIRPILPAGYLLGGLLWFAASVLTPAVVITEHGVIAYTKSGRHRFAWRQVADYFYFERERVSGFVFFYTDRGGRRRRVQVIVPVRHRIEFDHLLSHYLDARMERLPEETFGDSTTEG